MFGKDVRVCRRNTPLEKYVVGGREIWVKREDLCVPPDGSFPHFAKVRGVEAHLKKVSHKVLGVVDGYPSRNGWCVVSVARLMGKTTVVFYPVRKSEGTLENHPLRPAQQRAKELGAILYPLKAGRSAVLYNRAKKILAEEFQDSYMLPSALKLTETVEETAKEVQTVPDFLFRKAYWIISTSTATVASGVIKGLHQAGADRVIAVLHMGYSRPEGSVLKYIGKHVPLEELEGKIKIWFVDEGYEYSQKVEYPCPFPCNGYYDLKAWKWLRESVDKLRKSYNIVFWNIGD